MSEQCTDLRRQLLDLKKVWTSNVVARSAVFSFTGGAVTPGTVANADSKREGPEGAFKIGRAVVYPVDNFIDWLLKRASKVEKKRYHYLAESRKQVLSHKAR